LPKGNEQLKTCPLNLGDLPFAAVGGSFAAAALCVWLAGTRLAGYVSAIAEQTGLGKAFTGMLLLGGITSLPEVAAVSTAAAIGNAPLAINNLLGTASVNLILLALADFLYGRNALTSVAASPATLMQGVLSMLLASVVAIFAAAGDIAIWGFGAGSAILLAGAGSALWIASSFEKRHVWEATRRENPEEDEVGAAAAGPRPAERDWPLRKLIIATAIAALVILAAGSLLAATADVLATRTGVQAGMVGFLLVGLSTSLPEISSITAAVRLREYDMAVGDVFGTNLFNLSLIFVADVIFVGEPVLSSAGMFEVVGAILACMLTGIYLVGLLERRSRAVLRMGYDSLIALLVFGAGVLALSTLDT
jgi:cation:H+ antiporter